MTIRFSPFNPRAELYWLYTYAASAADRAADAATAVGGRGHFPLYAERAAVACEDSRRRLADHEAGWRT